MKNDVIIVIAHHGVGEVAKAMRREIGLAESYMFLRDSSDAFYAGEAVAQGGMTILSRADVVGLPKGRVYHLALNVESGAVWQELLQICRKRGLECRAYYVDPFDVHVLRFDEASSAFCND